MSARAEMKGGLHGAAAAANNLESTVFRGQTPTTCAGSFFCSVYRQISSTETRCVCILLNSVEETVRRSTGESAVAPVGWTHPAAPSGL